MGSSDQDNDWNRVQFKLNFSENLRDRIAESAKINKRTMTREIVERLERGFYTDAAIKTNKAIMEMIDNSFVMVDQALGEIHKMLISINKRLPPENIGGDRD